jgi:hypothetical protein
MESRNNDQRGVCAVRSESFRSLTVASFPMSCRNHPAPDAPVPFGSFWGVTATQAVRLLTDV